MISEWVMEASAAFLEFVAGWFPPVELPLWVQQPFEGVQQVVAVVEGAGTWVDVGFLAGVIGVVLIVYGFGLAVRLGRALIAHIPLVGGGG